MLAVLFSGCSDILAVLKEPSKAYIRDRPTMRIQQGEINGTVMSRDLLIYR
jgi:hypothetical protein